MIALLVLAQPLMTVPDKVILKSLSKEDSVLNSKIYTPRQGTRWTLKEGTIVGEPSTPEYQANRKDHKGLEPRLAIPSTPQDFCAEFDIRFGGGSMSKVAPFIEYGHHKARFSFGKDSLTLDANSEKSKLASSDKVKFQSDHWYHVTAEQKGEEALIQVDGISVYGANPSFKVPAEKGAAGLGFCGTQGGTIEINGLKIWSIKPEFAQGWSDQKAKLGGG